MHITNLSQGFLTVRRLAKGERKLRVADGHETDAEAVGTLPLLLSSGFILNLNNVLLVPIMRRNLIFISVLDDNGIHCNFGNNKCLLKFDDAIVGLAPRHDKLYLLPLNDSSVMNVCDVTNKRKRSITNETSSKLWHYCLGHISMGRMGASH